MIIKIWCRHKPAAQTKIAKQKIKDIGPKVNQFINTLIRNCMPNIRILAYVDLQIFCSQGCSYTKCFYSQLTKLSLIFTKYSVLSRTLRRGTVRDS